jgi:hypothetical protein
MVDLIMTRAQAIEEVLAHLGKKVGEMADSDLDVSNVAEAINQLRIGNPEQALNILDKEALHWMGVVAGDFDRIEIEGTADTAFWKKYAQDKEEIIAQWRLAFAG